MPMMCCNRIAAIMNGVEDSSCRACFAGVISYVVVWFVLGAKTNIVAIFALLGCLYISVANRTSLTSL
jgi:hypothetical protein